MWYLIFMIMNTLFGWGWVSVIMTHVGEESMMKGGGREWWMYNYIDRGIVGEVEDKRPKFLYYHDNWSFSLI